MVLISIDYLLVEMRSGVVERCGHHMKVIQRFFDRTLPLSFGGHLFSGCYKAQKYAPSGSVVLGWLVVVDGLVQLDTVGCS